MVAQAPQPTGVPQRGADTPYRLVARAANPGGTIVYVGSVPVGGPEFVVAAGPCAVETEEQVRAAAGAVRAAGARILRGGAFKPRTSPYAFQGHGIEGLRLLSSAGRECGLPIVTEVVRADDIAAIAAEADALQVGARNVQNFELLKALGAAGKPVLLKRGMSTTIDELLLAAEYVLAHGNPDVILCERGIRSFDPSTRNTLDLAAVPVLKARTHLPVIVDPSHGTGRRDLVAPLAKAAAAVGADGLIIEVHPVPDEAWSDGAQSLSPTMFADLMRELAGHLALEGRTLAPPALADLRSRALAAPLESYRDRIDSIDAQIVELLQQRVELGHRLGTIKQAAGQPIWAPEREEAVLDRVVELAGERVRVGALTPAAMTRVFTTIISETRAVQESAARIPADRLSAAG